MRKIFAILMFVCLAFVAGEDRAYAAEVAPTKTPNTPSETVGDTLGGAAIAPANPAETTKKGPWRIAYIEGGPFSDYWRVLQGLTLELQARDIIKRGDVPLPSGEGNTSTMWDWLRENAGGDQVEFLEGGVYSANWDADERQKTADALTNRLRDKKDVDVILAFGTWAGQDMGKLDTTVPVIVASVTNAKESGIISSADDSGRDNLTAAINPERFVQQVSLFYDIFRFKTLGIVYEDTPSGRDSVALGDIEKAASDLGVELVRCTDQFDIPDVKLAVPRLLACHQKLADAKVDAVYITYNTGMQPGMVDDVLAPLAAVGIPTFSQAGSHEVEQGVLLSISQASFGEEGAFSGKALAEIIKGALPRDLPQRMENPVSLSMNLRMATLIGWNPSLEILAAIDEIYRGI